MVYKNYVIVAHKFTTQPDDELVQYLNNRKCGYVMHICHNFSDAPTRYSWYYLYKEGVLNRQYKTIDYKFLPEPFMYFKEWFYTTFWIMRSGILWNKYIGMDGLCVLFGNLLRKIGKVEETVFWAIDFVPKNRFNSLLKNKIYQWVNIHGYKSSNEVWDLSPRMAEARQYFLGINKDMYKKRLLVPFGIWSDRIRKYTFNECEKDTLVFMGHLLEKQGVQLIIKLIPEILKRNPNFKFKIIGDGEYKNQLIELARKLNIQNSCEFIGKIQDHKVLENEIAKSALAIAPYIGSLDKWTYYSDPGKVKTYLGCGVPVLLTNIPWNANDIVKYRCGIIITERAEDIIESIFLLLDPKINQEYRNNAKKYAKSFNYQNIFKNLDI